MEKTNTNQTILHELQKNRPLHHGLHRETKQSFPAHELRKMREVFDQNTPAQTSTQCAMDNGRWFPSFLFTLLDQSRCPLVFNVICGELFAPTFRAVRAHAWHAPPSRLQPTQEPKQPTKRQSTCGGGAIIPRLSSAQS